MTKISFGYRKTRASVSSAERNGSAICGLSVSPFPVVPGPSMRMSCRPCDVSCRTRFGSLIGEHERPPPYLSSDFACRGASA